MERRAKLPQGPSRQSTVAQPLKQVQERRRCGRDLDCFEVGGTGMAGDLGIEVVAESDCVLAGRRLPEAAVPNLRLPQEVEPAVVDDRSRRARRLCRKEHCGTENPLECRYDAAELLAAVRHADGVEHLGRRPVADRLTLSTDRQCRQENEDQSIQAERKAELRVDIIVFGEWSLYRHL